MVVVQVPPLVVGPVLWVSQSPVFQEVVYLQMGLGLAQRHSGNHEWRLGGVCFGGAVRHGDYGGDPSFSPLAWESGRGGLLELRRYEFF